MRKGAQGAFFVELRGIQMEFASWLRSCWRSEGERVERAFCAKSRAFEKAGEGCGGVGVDVAVVRDGVGRRVGVF